MEHVSRFSTPISLSLNSYWTGNLSALAVIHEVLGLKLLLTCEHVLGAARIRIRSRISF
jgi:hypothetical protein